MDQCRKSGITMHRGYGPLQRAAAGEKNYSVRKELFGLVGKLAALAFLFCAGCQGTAKHPVPLVAQTPNYLNPGDVVKISFPAAPELNQTQKVGTDGSLSLPRLRYLLQSAFLSAFQALVLHCKSKRYMMEFLDESSGGQDRT